MRQVAIIRADGNREIGMGHLMRCTSLAQALAEVGYEVIFVSGEDSPFPLIAEGGFEQRLLSKPYDSYEEELDELMGIIGETHSSVVLVDSYRASDEYLLALHGHAKVFAFSEQRQLRCGMDIACDYNLSADRAWFEMAFASTPTIPLVGPRFAPLRRCFWDIEPKDASDGCQELLITTGGSDDLNVCGSILEALSERKELSALKKHVLVGPYFSHADELYKRWQGDSSVILHSNTDSAELLGDMDIAVSASGTTVYELMRYGIPSAFFAVADNQLPAEDVLGPFGYCGDVRGRNAEVNPRTIEKIAQRVTTLVSDASLRLELSRKMRNVVDGQGARRIAQAISGL